MPVHTGGILSGGIMSGNVIFNIFTSWYINQSINNHVKGRTGRSARDGRK